MDKTLLELIRENTAFRDLEAEEHALVQKWEKFGLLEGLVDTPRHKARSNMAKLLENQAKRLLKESTSMAGGDVEGYATSLFPLVRRTFERLIANDLVSVQTMDRPNGLVYFLDITYANSRLGATAGDSIYGGGVVGSQITGGISLTGANIEQGFYNLNNGYSSPTGSSSLTFTSVASGTYGAGAGGTWAGTAAYTALADKLLQYDPDVASGTVISVATTPKSALTTAQYDFKNYVAIDPEVGFGRVQRRLTVDDPTDSTKVLFVLAATASETTDQLASNWGSVTTTFPIVDNFNASTALGSVVGAATWGLEADPEIPELDMKIDSISIEAKSKKLKAKWTQEVEQDMNAYHNVDAEVELTNAMSDHIKMEINYELLEDLVKGATAAKYYWSRRPGRFLDRSTGEAISTSANESLLGADFTGNVSEWYETLAETINDASAQIHRKLKRGGANFIVCSPEVANILEFTSGFKASVTHDEEMGEIGAMKVGNLRRKWDVYVDSNFYRNVVLVGRKGSSFLESGYVFAPYTPIETFPTLLDVESFAPRKGMMTRFAKKMIKPDHYSLVFIEDFFG